MDAGSQRAMNPRFSRAVLKGLPVRIRDAERWKAKETRAWLIMKQFAPAH